MKFPAFVTRERAAFTIVLLVNLVLVSPALMPAYADINPDDEAKYIQSGWLLLKGNIRDLAWGPLVAFVYAPVHLVVGNSPDWFMLEAWAGRFILFIFLWLSIFSLAHQFKDDLPPPILAGVLFVTTPFFLIVANQSDALFVSLSVLALAKLIAYYRRRRLKDVWMASIFVGLGILARVESILLIGTLAVVSIVIGRRSQPVFKILIAAVLPALGILALFFIASLITVGNFNLGVGSKAYDSFEMNQPLPGADTEQIREETRRLFGTRQENNGSVIRAILRNPPAFAMRILVNAKNMPGIYLKFFGKTQGPILALFSAWGLYALIKKRAVPLLGILLAWSLQAVISLGFLAQHFIPQTCYLPLVLGAIGLANAFDRNLSRVERAILPLASVLLFIYSLAGAKPAFLLGSLLLSAVFGLAWLLWPHLPSGGLSGQIPLLLLLAAGLILRDRYPFPNYPVLGQSMEERAVHYMEQALPPLSKVLGPNPLPALAARMDDSGIGDLPEKLGSPQDLSMWLNQQGVRAVYLDSRYDKQADLPRLLEFRPRKLFRCRLHFGEWGRESVSGKEKLEQ